MSDTSPKDAVKAALLAAKEVCSATGAMHEVGMILDALEARSQLRKQALLEAAEIYDKQTGREMFGPTVAEELRKLAEE